MNIKVQTKKRLYSAYNNVHVQQFFMHKPSDNVWETLHNEITHTHTQDSHPRNASKDIQTNHTMTAKTMQWIPKKCAGAVILDLMAVSRNPKSHTSTPHILNYSHSSNWDNVSLNLRFQMKLVYAKR